MIEYTSTRWNAKEDKLWVEKRKFKERKIILVNFNFN